MRRTRHLQSVLAVLAVSLFAAGYAVYAGCGSCGPAAAGDKQAAGPKTCCPAAKPFSAKAAKTKCGPGCAKACCAKKESAKATLSTATLQVLLRAKVPVVLLDARGGTKYDDARRIPGAKPLAVNASPEQLAAAVPSKDALIVTYCGSRKCPLSHRLSHRLKKAGYTNLLEYPDGIKGWAQAGNPLDGPAKPSVAGKKSCPAGCKKACCVKSCPAGCKKACCAKL